MFHVKLEIRPFPFPWAEYITKCFSVTFSRNKGLNQTELHVRRPSAIVPKDAFKPLFVISAGIPFQRPMLNRCVEQQSPSLRMTGAMGVKWRRSSTSPPVITLFHFNLEAAPMLMANAFCAGLD
jgi:hypothetical protein